MREKSIGSSDRHVEDQIEVLVKRCVELASLTPRIEEGAFVDDVLSESSPVPHVPMTIIKREEENLL